MPLALTTTQAMRSAIKEATASMTSVPKPLKFLRGHYGTLKETLDTVAAGDNRRAVRSSLNSTATVHVIDIYSAT